MTDITKCSGIKCELRNICWRYAAPVFESQAWSAFYADESFSERYGCDYFLPVLRAEPPEARV